MYIVETAANGEPVNLSEAKAWLKVEHNEEDALILDLIRSAREVAEHDTGLALLTQTINQYHDAWPCDRIIYLEVSPLATVTSVKYRDSAGTYQTFSSSNYTVDAISQPPRIVLNVSASWPTYGSFPNAIQIIYTAGVDIAADVLARVRQSILMTVAFLYQNREDIPMVDHRIRSSQWLLRKSRVSHI